MVAVVDPFMAGIRPSGLQRGRGGFLRSADDAPYVSDPSGDTVASGKRKGEVKRLKYGSPSNRGREIENDAGLVKYKQRLTLLGIGMEQSLATACSHLADFPIGSPEFNTAADTIVVCADRITRSELAADRGTHGHWICQRVDEVGVTIEDLIVTGEAVGLDRNTQLSVADAWGEMLIYNGLEILAIEAACVDDTWRLAGTLDRIVRTTKPLHFAKPSGEIVMVPTNTVLVLDIKFGRCRKAHPIQIASYAQSVPYDTDTEVRGEWPWVINQTHALIAHGDFGDEFRPSSIELVWVDLVAGREHGGETVVQAKAWAARDDVFSVAQIVEAGFAAEAKSTRITASTLIEGDVEPPAPAPSAGEVAAPVQVPASPATPFWDEVGITDPTVNDLLPRQGMPQHAMDELEVDRLNDARRQSYKDVYEVGDATHDVNNWPLADPARLKLVDARGALCASPDEGHDWSGGDFKVLWEQLRGLYDELDVAARSWRAELASQAVRRHVDFLAQGGRTERRYHINKAIVALGLAGESRWAPWTPILRELLAHIIGDVALMLGVEPGHALGSLSAAEAERFATHVDAYLSPLPVA